jgi:hypothetical protein
MKYFVIFLILVGFFSSSYATQYQSPETDKPINSENSIHVVPEILWDIHEVILDGTIVEYNNNTRTYHIKINQVFKGSLNSDLISAEGFDIWNDFKKGDRALFYIYDISPVSTNYNYKITDYSVKTTPTCDARSLIQITPTLPNEDSFVRGAPTIPADWEDPCVPNYFSYDPDVFNFREAIAPLKQIKHKIPIDKIRCYDNKVIVFRNSDGSPACVKPETKTKLFERGWIKTELSIKTNSQSVFLEGFQDSYNINDSIRFTLVFKSGQKCGTIELSLIDTKTSEFVNGIGFDDMCNSPYLFEDLRISIPYQGDNSPFKTDKIGSYKIVITNDAEVVLEKEFVVKNADQS